MSPKTMAVLAKSSPSPRRSSSGSTGLRPVMPFRLDETDGSAVELEDTQDDEPELGPMPREQSTPFAEGAGVDEVESAYW